MIAFVIDYAPWAIPCGMFAGGVLRCVSRAWDAGRRHQIARCRLRAMRRRKRRREELPWAEECA